MLKNLFDGNEIPLILLGFTPLLQNLAEVSTFLWIKLVCWMMSKEASLNNLENQNKLYAPIISY